MAFELASLFVSIKADDDPLQKQVNGVRSQLTGMGVAIGTAAGNLLTSAILGAASAITGFISKGIGGATDLAETISKVNTVFGASAASMVAQANQMADAFGLPKQQILDAEANIGLVGKAAGQSQAQAAAMANTMAKLAADASSFYNVPMDVALEKIRSGLVGESEPLRAFGVLLSEEAVANEAVAMGLAKTTAQVDQQSKVMARASLIQKGMVDATGDLERTADSTANQWRKFTGTLDNLAVSVGTSLAPAINSLVGVASSMASALASAFEASKGSFAAFAQGVAEWVDIIRVAWRNLPDLWEIVQIKATEMGLNIIAVVETIPDNLNIVGDWIANNWLNMLSDAFTGVQTIFSNLVENLSRAWQAFTEYLKTGEFNVNFRPLLDGFVAATGELPTLIKPELQSLQGDIDAVTQRMSDRETARAQGIAQRASDATKPAQQAATAAAAKKEKAFKSELIESDAFYERLVSQALSGKDDTQKEQLAAQKKTADNTDQIARLLGAGIYAKLA